MLPTQSGAPTQDCSLRSRSSTTSLTTWSAAAARIMALIPRARVIVLTGWSSSTLALASQRFRDLIVVRVRSTVIRTGLARTPLEDETL